MDEDELEFDEDYQDEEESDDDEEDDDIRNAHGGLALLGNIFRGAHLRLRPQQLNLRKRRVRPGQENLEPVPSEEGRELMWGGEFGQVCLYYVYDKRILILMRVRMIYLYNLPSESDEIHPQSCHPHNRSQLLLLCHESRQVHLHRENLPVLHYPENQPDQCRVRPIPQVPYLPGH